MKPTCMLTTGRSPSRPKILNCSSSNDDGAPFSDWLRPSAAIDLVGGSSPRSRSDVSGIDPASPWRKEKSHYKWLPLRLEDPPLIIFAGMKFSIRKLKYCKEQQKYNFFIKL